MYIIIFHPSTISQNRNEHNIIYLSQVHRKCRSVSLHFPMQPVKKKTRSISVLLSEKAFNFLRTSNIWAPCFRYESSQDLCDMKVVLFKSCLKSFKIQTSSKTSLAFLMVLLGGEKPKKSRRMMDATVRPSDPGNPKVNGTSLHAK